MNNTITFLPDPGPWPIVTPRSVLNGGSTSSIELQGTFAAENAPKRIIHGMPRIGPLVVTTLPYLAGAVIFCYWGYGECDSVVSYTIDNKAPPSGCTAQHYMGTQTQTVDPLLVLAFNANGITFTDALLGECYSVFYVPSTATPGFPRFNVIIKGLKVYDSRLDSTNGGSGSQRLATPTTWAWSDTPALCLANFLTNTVYGAGKTMLWASVASVANDNEALVGGTEKHRTLNLCIDKVQRTQDWIDTLQTYAGCWTMTSGDDMKLVSDKAGSSVATLTHADGDIREIKNLRLRGSQGVPSAVIVYYTDTSTIPYTDKSAVATDGTADKRYSTVYLLGINRYSQAMREAIERLNKLRLSDLSFDLGTFAAHGALEPGEIITVTWPAVGLTSKLVRIGNSGGGYGHPDFQCTEYDPLFYDSSVAAAPTYPDTSLPDPLGTLAPPTVLIINEELYETRDYSYASRLVISWTAASDFYPIRYWVTISDATHIVNSGYVLGTAYAFGPLEDGVTYTVNVYAERESTQIRSIALTDTQVAAGNSAVPGNVANFALIPTDTGSRLTWDAVTNVDLAGYFAQATAIWNPALPVVVSKIQFIDLDPLAATTYGFSIKAVNFSGNVSATAGTITYVATVPATPTLVGNAYFNAVVLSWDDCRTTNPLTHVSIEVTKDSVFLEDRLVYGNLRTVTYFETASGSYAYRVRAHDYYVPGTYSNTVTLSVVAGSPVTVVDAAGDPTLWILFAGEQTGALSPKTDVGMTYNATSQVLSLYNLSIADTTTASGVILANAGVRATNSVFNPNTLSWVNAAFKAHGSYGGGLALLDTGANAGYGIHTSALGTVLHFGYGVPTGGLSDTMTVDSSGNAVLSGALTSVGLTVNDDPIFVGSTGFNAAGEMARVKVGNANYGLGAKYGTGMSLYVLKTAGGSAYNTDSIDAISIAETTGAVTIASTLGVTGMVAASGGITASGARSAVRGNSEIYALSIHYSASAGGCWLGGTNSATPDLIISNAGGSSIATFKNNRDVDFSGAATIPGTLGVTGATTLSSTLSVAGATTLGLVPSLQYPVAPVYTPTTAVTNAILTLGRGTAASPFTGATYITPDLYIERFTNSGLIGTNYAGWGNAYKQSAQLISVKAGAAEANEVNGLAIYVHTDSPQIGANSPLLVGISAMVDADNSGGTGKYASGWAANFIARFGTYSGTKPQDCVGVEVDIINSADSDGVVPVSSGTQTTTNYTGYWAQAAGEVGGAGKVANTAFLATNVTTSGAGWNNGFVANGNFTAYLAYLKTSNTAGNGIYVDLPTSTTGYPLTLQKNGANIFVVDGSGNATVAGKTYTAASATAQAGLNVAHGAAPTTPANGDVWTTTAGMFAYINGATRIAAFDASGIAYTPTLSTGTNTSAVVRSNSKDFVYTVVGDTVYCSGRVDITFTSASTYSYVDVTLPITAADADQINGHGTGAGNSGICWPVYGAGTSTTNIRFACYPNDSGAKAHTLFFSYRK